jgi:uncharacterized protein (TIGR02466 family)
VIADTQVAAWLRGAWAALRSGSPAQADEYCQQVIRRDASNFDGWRMLAMARLALGDDEAVGEALERALALRPHDAGTAFDRGSWLLHHNRPGEARPLLQIAMEAMPHEARAAFRHGTACFRENDFSAAAASFKAAAIADPQWSQAWHNLSAAHGRLQDYPAAIAAAREALSLEPEAAISHQALAALLSNLFDQESLREGLKAAERALQLQPEFAEAHRNAAILLRKLGHQSRAEVHARRAYELAPDDLEVLETLCDQLMLGGQSDSAADLYAAARRSGVESPAIIRQHGIALLRSGRAHEARIALAESLAARSDDQRTIAHVGLALAATEGIDAAIDFIGLKRHIKALTLIPPSGFEDADSFHRALADDIRAHSQQRWEPAGLAARSAYLSGDLLLDRTAAIIGFEQRLREAIDAFLVDCRKQRATGMQDVFLANVPDRYRLHVWATLAGQGGYIDTHIHEDSWLSGAYYVQVPPAIQETDLSHAGWIEFGRPHAGLPQWPEDALLQVLPRAGTLLLFPSYLFHRTLPYSGGGERISISFDLAAI